MFRLWHRVRDHVQLSLDLDDTKSEVMCNALFAYLRLRSEQGDADECLFGPIDDMFDDAWHTIILETQLYEELCSTIHGRIIHHKASDSRSHPLLKAERRKRTRDAMSGLEEFKDYWRVFGTEYNCSLE